MQYTDSLEKSSEYLRLALDHMGRHQIPVDPANYSVWYEYVSGRNQQLSLVIDWALSQSTSITPELNKTLYEKYIASEHKIIIQKIRQDLRAVLDTLLEHITDSGSRMTRFTTMIRIYSQRLKEDLDTESVQAIVEDILSESSAVRRSGRMLKNRIVLSTREIESLRKDLDRIKEEADTDMLTGLKNRRFLVRQFKEECELAIRDHMPLSLIIIDIDHFKRINDTHGHIVGDRVLKIAASMIKECVKGRDMVVRFGGEEFVVLLPDTPLNGAAILAEHICTYFKNMNWKRKDTGQTIGQVFISLGVSEYRPGETLDSFIHRADEALYLSKTNGRCRVTSEASLKESYVAAQKQG